MVVKATFKESGEVLNKELRKKKKERKRKIEPVLLIPHFHNEFKSFTHWSINVQKCVSRKNFVVDKEKALQIANTVKKEKRFENITRNTLTAIFIISLSISSAFFALESFVMTFFKFLNNPNVSSSANRLFKKLVWKGIELDWRG